MSGSEAALSSSRAARGAEVAVADGQQGLDAALGVPVEAGHGQGTAVILQSRPGVVPVAGAHGRRSSPPRYWVPASGADGAALGPLGMKLKNSGSRC